MLTARIQPQDRVVEIESAPVDGLDRIVFTLLIEYLAGVRFNQRATRLVKQMPALRKPNVRVHLGQLGT
jgi:hypothetical protein